MKISVLTLFPQMFAGPTSESILKHAQEKGLVTYEFINIRDFGIGRHKIVDDTPYGGGLGMVMRVDVVHKTIEAARDKSLSKDEERVVLMTADGATYSQRVAERYSQLKHLILVCGHYEGLDERIKAFVDEEVSLGDFVLTGGEIPAMAIIDSVTRLIPRVLKEGVTESESFSLSDGSHKLLEFPTYTRPEEYQGMNIPDVLLSGHHTNIEAWRKAEAMKKTEKRRPDLLKKS
jgi:tRNA (guanine37-N1)-methyltransferase